MKFIVKGTKAAVVGRDAGTWIDLVVRNGESLCLTFILFSSSIKYGARSVRGEEECLDRSFKEKRENSHFRDNH